MSASSIDGNSPRMPTIGLDLEVLNAELPESWPAEIDLKVRAGTYNAGTELSLAAGHLVDDLGSPQKALIDLRRMAFVLTYRPSVHTQARMDAQAAARPPTPGDEVAQRLNQFESSTLGSAAYSVARVAGATEKAAQEALDAGTAVSQVLPLVAAAGAFARSPVANDGRLRDGWHTAEQAARNERFVNSELARSTAVPPRVVPANNVSSETVSTLASFDLYDPAIWLKPNRGNGIEFTPPAAYRAKAAIVDEADRGPWRQPLGMEKTSKKKAANENGEPAVETKPKLDPDVVHHKSEPERSAR